MDDSFDERSETDINDCSEDILEGEEDIFGFRKSYDHESDTLYNL